MTFLFDKMINNIIFLMKHDFLMNYNPHELHLMITTLRGLRKM